MNTGEHTKFHPCPFCEYELLEDERICPGCGAYLREASDETDRDWTKEENWN